MKDGECRDEACDVVAFAPDPVLPMREEVKGKQRKQASKTPAQITP